MNIDEKYKNIPEYNEIPCAVISFGDTEEAKAIVSMLKWQGKNPSYLFLDADKINVLKITKGNPSPIWIKKGEVFAVGFWESVEYFNNNEARYC